MGIFQAAGRMEYILHIRHLLFRQEHIASLTKTDFPPEAFQLQAHRSLP